MKNLGFYSFEKINQYVSRLGTPSLYVDIVFTESGIIRIGSMPDILKLTRYYGIKEKYVVVTDWEVSQGGDNRTGEEWILWSVLLRNNTPKIYIGTKKNIESLYDNLNHIVSYYFDKRCLKIVKRDWLKRYFKAIIIDSDKPFRDDKISIEIHSKDILIKQNDNPIYKPTYIGINKNTVNVEKILENTRYIKSSINDLTIFVIGNGNGFTNITSNFIISYTDRAIWIDPTAQPIYTLSYYRLNVDTITDILITHNHEDHIQGFSALLKRKEEKGEHLNLLTSNGIYLTLKRQFLEIFPDMDEYINFIEIDVNKSLNYKGIVIEARLNHHILPYGTLGLKFHFRNSTFCLSGDTKYNRKINCQLRNKKLFPVWLEDCDLIFHEVDFSSPKSVHTYFKDLLKLKRYLKKEIYVYHTPRGNNKFKMAEEGMAYVIVDGKIKTKKIVNIL